MLNIPNKNYQDEKNFYQYGEWNDTTILALDTWNGYYNNIVVKEILGDFLRCLTIWKENKKQMIYTSKTSERIMWNLARKKFLANPHFFQEVLQDFYQKRQKKKTRIGKISQMNFTPLTNGELAALFLETRKIIGFFGAYDWVPFSYDNHILEAVDLDSYVKDHPQEKDAILEITMPNTILPTLAEEIEVLKLALKIKARIKDLKKEKIEQDIQPELKGLVEKYGWLPALIIYPLKKEGDYAQQISEIAKEKMKDIQEKLQEKEDFLPSINQRYETYLKQYHPPKKVIDSINAIRTLSEMRAVGEMDTIYCFSRCRTLDKEIQKRLHISSVDYFLLYIDEVIAWLQGKKQHIDFKSRKRIEAFYRDEDGKFKRAEHPEEIYHKLSNVKTTEGELKGMPGCPGKVTGKVKIIHSSQDIHSFKEGDILVAKATCVDYVVIMKKASAIVTEFGGITSHAAVVSRELNVPSVIGVKNITSILKDGDLVEVDASKGYIKKIKDIKETTTAEKIIF